VWPLVERAWFRLCLALGKLLRAARYSSVQVVNWDGERTVRKRRSFYAPLLIWLSDPLMRILDTGVRVLPQRQWEERERAMYGRMADASVRIEGGGTLVLPALPGETLAMLLENPLLDASGRTGAIELAVKALAELHRSGFTHGDAMAENVMVDLDGGIARWFDFETVHESNRAMTWRRADDMRALLATSVVRTSAHERAEVIRLMVEVYGDNEVTEQVAHSFASGLRRPLMFHLGQAGLPFRDFKQLARMVRGVQSRSAIMGSTRLARRAGA
jgi:serine/threonine protein kinase